MLTVCIIFQKILSSAKNFTKDFKASVTWRNPPPLHSYTSHTNQSFRKSWKRIKFEDFLKTAFLSTGNKSMDLQQDDARIQSLSFVQVHGKQASQLQVYWQVFSCGIHKSQLCIVCSFGNIILMGWWGRRQGTHRRSAMIRPGFPLPIVTIS